MHKFPDLPPIWTATVALAIWAIGRLMPIVSFSAPIWLLVLPALLGLLLILWSAFWFWRKRTSIEPGHVPRALIVEGPYRISRNPIYLGMWAVLLSVAFWVGALSGFVPFMVFPLIITRRFIIPEEDALQQAFGAEATAYFAATRRWVLM